MVYFSKLRLYGFKSFVDKTELDIGPGLNGIVGPNGCGKSNLVEALRWVMGEKSAKNMRGAGMEDVIFAGTSKRPARNMAEVTVVMNNEDGSAPAPFNATTEIEINRRIEREKGSQFRVNGKAVRARDVNLLFADTMTGASSPALVSQGRITEIITAKPSDRRQILEESAGIAGLHTRRHEAELRLRAAEQNLTRLNDSLNDLRTRLASLKRQARQAERYKELNDAIRRLDLALSWSEWSAIHTKIKSDRAAFARHNETVQTAIQETKRLSDDLERLDSTLPQKRKETTEAQAILQNFRVSLERLEQDIKIKTKGLQDSLEVKSQLAQDSDFTQEQLDQTLSDLESARTALAVLLEEATSYPDHIAETERRLQSEEADHTTLTQEKQAIETALAVAKESRAALTTQTDALIRSADKNAANIAMLEQAITESEQKLAAIDDDPVLSVNIADMDLAVVEQKEKMQAARDDQAVLQATLSDMKARRDDLTAGLKAMEGEYNGLQSLIARAVQDKTLPQGDAALINHIQVDKGYEKALSVALGQWATMAGMNEAASVFWTNSAASVEAPKGTAALSLFVRAPEVLRPLLNAVGIAEDGSQQNAAPLTPGQMIITKDGSLTRWDGLHVQASAALASDTAGLLLEQKNRASDLRSDIDQANILLNDINQKMEVIQSDYDKLSQFLDTASRSVSTLESQRRDTAYRQERLNDQKAALLEKLSDQKDRLLQNITERDQLQAQLKILQQQLETTDDQTAAQQMEKRDDLVTRIADAQSRMNETRQTLAEWRQRQTNASSQTGILQSRIDRAESEIQKLNARLDDISARQDTNEAKILSYRSEKDDDSDVVREGLLSKIAQQDQVLKDLTIVLDGFENDNKRLQADLRQAEAAAASAREQRAIAQTNVANAENDLKMLEERISDRFEFTPQRLEEQVFSLFNDQIPSTDDLLAERETITRQRDGIGPVNLRAALECTETEAQLADLEREYNDLTKAIEQLRGGIAKLNREAKDRLAIAFQRVDQHFQTLFSQLFNGGKAYLEMIQNDDPLESGLEIYAQPPGKALQKLSLLSGGEQTLTATALIFAMFLTNPSPVCVLDEIDAPLDDANVDRVCSLMETISRETDTRFIVITHHRMTMARMDRLYGVTMTERGVSQLVSVDLAMQAELELAERA